MAKKQNREADTKSGGGIGGLLSGLADLVEKLGELAEKGEGLTRTGDVQVKTGERGRDLKAVYGLSIRTGAGGRGARVEPFGNVRKDRTTGESMVQEVHEPLIDVFDEEDYVLVLAEMPGVDAEDVHLELDGHTMSVSAEGENKKYHKEIVLPGEFRLDKVTVTSKNGIIKIKCMK